MALNPIAYTEKVVRSFLRYQLSAYPFADKRLHAQMRHLLSLDETRQSPLLKGPYISLSRPFRQGAAVADLVAEGVFHPHMRQRIPAEITHLYGHQEEAVRSIQAGRTTLVSTGTGSGKTECFLYPVISRCLDLRDSGVPVGISAVLVYPMNALAEDQLGRLRGLLAGTGITFGIYVGKTPDLESEVTGIRLPAGSSRADYEARLAAVRREGRSESVLPAEEVCSREKMRQPGGAPRILLTNVKQLELLLTRGVDAELFAGARLDYLIFDEAHTFTGAQGAETACLIRRLRAFCGRREGDTVCVATSATIVDQDNPDAAWEFAARFFGVDRTRVATVGEVYEPEVWLGARATPGAPTGDPESLLAACAAAVDDEGDRETAVRAAYRGLAGRDLPAGPLEEALHGALSGNEIAHALSELLASPRPLQELPAALQGRIERAVTEAEILAWLTLGAAARKDGRPLLRPVVHGFIRGISGAVVSFEDGSDEPRLWLAAEDEVEAATKNAGGESARAHFPVTTCTTCGQHYYIAHLADFEFTAKSPGGGEAAGDGSCWLPLDETRGGCRVVLSDRIIGGDDDDSISEHDRTAPLYFCRKCGAAHPEQGSRCLACGVVGGRVELYAIRQRKDNPGVLSSCLSCGATGRRLGTRYREPARAVRATNVADVHVLAQDMVHHSERERLLVFCDNRQDAAFQAGWMKDHARRFRLRSLMAEGLAAGPVSIGDLAHYLDDRLEKEEALSRALVPEVWQVVRKEGGGGRHEQERRKFLRIQVLREVTLSSRQAVGLEPWGRLKVDYLGLEPAHPWIQGQADALGLPTEELCEGIAGLLDYLRRKRALYDPEREIFSKYWMNGDLEVEQGYIPQFGGPVGTKLRRSPAETAEEKARGLITQWLSDRGETTIRQMAVKWGVSREDSEDFLSSAFEFLKETGLLKPVRLKGSKGNPLPFVSEVYQVDADRLRLRANRGVYRCGTCSRRGTRTTPGSLCPAWRCNGTIAFQREDKDSYDLQLLDQGYSMLRPEEHTAMVPHDERERLENLFKGGSDAVNCFVCTPTLELGVDIGRLDAILMRNVPPLPANYWQRAGRAGRRHRMAVDLTYCRPISHDRAYFADPLKLLKGRVDPPSFNLRNPLMVKKHVHSAVITRLQALAKDTGRSAAERKVVDDALRDCLPKQVSHYLFENGFIRERPFDLNALDQVVRGHLDELAAHVEDVFSQGWPEADADVVAPAELRGHVEGFVDDLSEVISRLHRRLRWALDQMSRLNALRLQRGDLDQEDDSLFNRCNRLVKRLKGTARRSRRDAEGVDDVSTFGVLAAEGFLPGYGLDTGSVVGSAEIPFWRTGAMDFVLPRPTSIALREYVPGNLIYANGHRFVARRFHRDVDEARIEMPVFEVSTERQAVKETGAGAAVATLGADCLRTIAVCDVDLAHQSHISDDEELRFQMGVAVYGLERDRHNGGTAWRWGERALHLRKGVAMRLVNVGASSAIERFRRLGYPICTVCGQSRSPLSSEKEREKFNESHAERCGRPIEPVGLYADVVADAMSLPACSDHTVAYSVLEALRMAATRVLDMHQEDLQILVIGHTDREEVDGLLWDPMPGGSGLLERICARFEDVVNVAREIVGKCPAVCDTSCIDCMQTFRNGFYHRYLDRRRALECLETWGARLSRSHEIPPMQPQQDPREGIYPVNEAERRLRHLLLAAGFGEGVRGEQIRLDRAIGTTTPDVIYRAAHHADNEGVCVYLDGLSAHIHGNRQTEQKDREIRNWLRNNGYDVIEIAVSDLHDEGAMTRHFKRLAGYLREDTLRSRISSAAEWFRSLVDGAGLRSRPQLRLVVPTPATRFVTCVPLYSLKAAAGGFSQEQVVEPEGWVEPDARLKLGEGMFVAQVVGKSMEPRIPDGSYCLFRHPVAGTREGKTVLVQLRSALDPESGERFTVKRYHSEKVESEDGWRHSRIELRPENPDFEPIVLDAGQSEQLGVVAEVVEVLLE